LILIMGLLGPRWAEAIGLKVCDINIEAGTITIQRSLTQVRGKFIEKSTKSGFSRTLDLPNFLKPMLSQHLIGKNQDDLVFTGTNGGPIDISNFRKRIYEPAFLKAGVVKANFKDLRTTAVSLMISINKPITVVAKIAGHKDPSITLRHYSELFDADFKQASIDLEAAFLKEDVHEMYTLPPIIEDIADSAEMIYPLTSGNESGPCRDRTGLGLCHWGRIGQVEFGGVMILLFQFKCINPKHQYTRNIIRGVSLLFSFLLVLNALSWANAQDGLDLYIPNSC
jgi:hypothetical protein